MGIATYDVNVDAVIQSRLCMWRSVLLITIHDSVENIRVSDVAWWDGVWCVFSVVCTLVLQTLCSYTLRELPGGLDT